MNNNSTGSKWLDEHSTVLERDMDGKPIAGKYPMGSAPDDSLAFITGIMTLALFGAVCFVFGKFVGKHSN